MALFSLRHIKDGLKKPGDGLRVILGQLLSKTASWWSDELFLRIKFWLRLNKKLNLNNPRTFSEKLQWLKLYDHRPEYTVMVDKVKAKEYVASIIGQQYIIPTLGVWEDPEQIEFESLPLKFVLKCNHNSGVGMFICKDKSKVTPEKWEQVKEELRRGLKNNAYYLHSREWPYKDVPRRILAEQYIDPKPNVKDLPDYKWFCFNGEPKYCQVIQDRSTIETIDFFNTEWKHQEFVGFNPKADNAVQLPECPQNLELHIRIARELSKGIPFARVDLYDTGDKVLFGEVTFYPAGGFGQFRPVQYNEIFGKMIELPEKRR